MRSLLQRQVISERKKKRLIFYTVFFIALLYIILNIIGDNGIFKFIELKKRKEGLEREIYRITEENRRLENQIEALRNDPFYIEKQAREDLGFSKPGEHIFEYER